LATAARVAFLRSGCLGKKWTRWWKTGRGASSPVEVRMMGTWGLWQGAGAAAMKGGDVGID
jgi:hypothetical protein